MTISPHVYVATWETLSLDCATRLPSCGVSIYLYFHYIMRFKLINCLGSYFRCKAHKKAYSLRGWTRSGEIVAHSSLGYSIRFRTPSINGRLISAEKGSFLSIVGTCVEQTDGTPYTVQGTDTLLLLGVIRPNCYRPETYENGRKSSVSRRRLVHRKT